MRCSTPSPVCDAGGVSPRAAYLAAEVFVDELEDELGVVELRHERLLIASGPRRPAAWAANIWLDPRENRDRLDFRCRGQIARDPAELGGLCAASLSPRHAHSREAAESIGQAARLWHPAAFRSPRLMDLARCRNDTCRAALHEPVLHHLFHNKHELTWIKIE
jgi:hypothetical protein